MFEQTDNVVVTIEPVSHVVSKLSFSGINTYVAGKIFVRTSVAGGDMRRVSTLTMDHLKAQHYLNRILSDESCTVE